MTKTETATNPDATAPRTRDGKTTREVWRFSHGAYRLASRG